MTAARQTRQTRQHGEMPASLRRVRTLVAIPAGHLGRRRAKRLDGHDRGAALFGIIAGWVLVILSLLIALRTPNEMIFEVVGSLRDR